MGSLDYFPAFFKYRQSLAGLDDAQIGRVFMAALAYAEDGKAPRLSQVEGMAFSFIRGDIDRARVAYEKRCEKNRENIQKRWGTDDPGTDSEDTSVYDGIRTNTNDTKQTNITNKQNKHVYERDARAHVREGNEIQTGGEGGNGFAAPDAEAVRHYCEEAGIAVNADRFVEHYGSLGWMKGGQPIRDWKALVRKWAREDKEKAAAEQAAVEESTGFSSFDTDDFAAAAFARTYGKGGGQ